MEAKEVLQQIGQYLYMAGIAIKDGAIWLWKAISAWYATLPLPTAIKLFSNDMANRYLFFGISVFLLIMNIWAKQNANSAVFVRVSCSAYAFSAVRSAE